MPENINNSYSKIFQLTWYCGIYKDDGHGLCPHDACNSKQEIRHIHESHDKTQKHRKIKKRNLNKRIIGIQTEDFYQDWEKLHEVLLYGVQRPFVWSFEKKKSTVFQKANMRNSLRCLPPRVAAFSTHFLARRASLAVRDYTHKISIS